MKIYLLPAMLFVRHWNMNPIIKRLSIITINEPLK